MCLGLGTFSGRSKDRSYRRLSRMLQLVFFLDIVNFLQATTNQPPKALKLYAQEPDFQPLDRQFLSNLAVQVLPCPQAVECIGVNTFLYTPYLDWKVTLVSLAGRDPLLYVGVDINNMIDTVADSDAFDYCVLSEERVGKAGATRGKDAAAIGTVAARFLVGREGIALDANAPMVSNEGSDQEWRDLVEAVMGLWISTPSPEDARYSFAGIGSVNGKPVYGPPRPIPDKFKMARSLGVPVINADAGEAEGLFTEKQMGRIRKIIDRTEKMIARNGP